MVQSKTAGVWEGMREGGRQDPSPASAGVRDGRHGRHSARAAVLLYVLVVVCVELDGVRVLVGQRRRFGLLSCVRKTDKVGA